LAQEDKITENPEDFKDFDDDENTNELPELEADLIDEKELMEQYETDNSIFHEKATQEKSEDTQEEVQEITKDATKEAQEEIQKTEEEKEEKPEITPWEELDDNNSVVKKYIFYISKDFIPYIDNLSTDERSAYVNDAIQIKIDMEDEKKQKEKKAKIISHFIVMILTFCLLSPVVLFITHKAIMATFDNYKYSQENFEKLYKQRFAKDKAYMRSIQYNKQNKQKNINK